MKTILIPALLLAGVSPAAAFADDPNAEKLEAMPQNDRLECSIYNVAMGTMLLQSGETYDKARGDAYITRAAQFTSAEIIVSDVVTNGAEMAAKMATEQPEIRAEINALLTKCDAQAGFEPIILGTSK